MQSNREMAEQVFQEELAQLTPQGREFALKVFEHLAPNYFFSAPASSSGKYHPAVSLGAGGIVRHTKYAFWWVKMLGRAFSIEPGSPELDACLVAILLHDLLKFGRKADPVTGRSFEGNTTATHGVTLAGLIQPLFIGVDVTPFFKEVVESGIAAHMGVWTKPDSHTCWNIGTSSQRVKHCVILVHLADMASAQKADECMSKLMEE